jgi:D-arginine dehydrogenase
VKAKGVLIQMGSPIRRIEKNALGFRVRTGEGDYTCKRIVNASGAWAVPVAEAAGASKLPLIPYQRHLFWSHAFGAISKAWPFVWHISHDFYFRPDKDGLMLSPCDKTSYGNEKFNPKVERVLIKKLNHFSSRFKGIRFYEAKAGLRTMAPDGRFVIGEDAKLSDFYWVAGLGGHGVTTSFSVGQLASDIILKRKTKTEFEKAFSPKRFKV